MQGNLCGFGHGAHEQQQADDGHGRPFDPCRNGDRLPGSAGGLAEHRLVVQAAEDTQHGGDAQQEPEIPDPVDQEGLQVGMDRRLPGVPEADQQVGHQAHGLPAEEQLQEVVRHDQHQHREREQGDVREKPLVAGIIMHVADRIDVHHQGHEGHHEHHGHGQRIDQEADLEVQPSEHRPPVHIDRHRCRRVHNDLAEYDQAQKKRQRHPANRDPVRPGTPDTATGQACNQGACQGSQHDDQAEYLHGSRGPSPSGSQGPAR